MSPQTPIKPTMAQLILEAMTEKNGAAYLSFRLLFKKKDTLSSCVALDDGTVLEAAELDAIALLADGTMIPW